MSDTPVLTNAERSINRVIDKINAEPNGKPAKPSLPNRDAEAAKLAAAVTEAEEALARDLNDLEAAKAEVERLKDWVAFDQDRIESRIKSRDTFDRLRAKGGK